MPAKTPLITAKPEEDQSSPTSLIADSKTQIQGALFPG